MKEKILLLAIKMFKKNGIKEMSIQKLISPLGISTKTLYKYFESKEELFIEVLRTIEEERCKELAQLRKDTEPIPLLLKIWYMAYKKDYGVNNKLLTDLKKYYPEIDKQIETEYGEFYWKEFHEIIKKGINEGVFIDKINRAIVLESMAALYGSACRRGDYDKIGAPLFDVFENSIVIFLRGICTSKGVDELVESLTILKKEYK